MCFGRKRKTGVSFLDGWNTNYEGNEKEIKDSSQMEIRNNILPLLHYLETHVIVHL